MQILRGRGKFLRFISVSMEIHHNPNRFDEMLSRRGDAISGSMHSANHRERSWMCNFSPTPAAMERSPAAGPPAAIKSERQPTSGVNFEQQQNSAGKMTER